VLVAVVPAFFRCLSVSVAVAAYWAGVDSISRLDMLDCALLQLSSSERGALFETVLCFVQFFAKFLSERISRSISDEAVNWPTIAEE